MKREEFTADLCLYPLLRETNAEIQGRNVKTRTRS